MLTDLNNCGLPAFQFAGFTFPKFVWTLPRGKFSKRIERMRNPVTGEYYHAPKPVNGSHPGAGFYLDSDGMPGLRWQWCDEVDGARIRHTGWFADDYQDTKIRGLVMRLPGSRGFLAGYSMGESMASAVDGYIYGDEVDAARAADSMAQNAADRDWEYQARQSQEYESEVD